MAAKARSGRPGGRRSAASGGQAARNRPLRDSVKSIEGELAGAGSGTRASRPDNHGGSHPDGTEVRPGFPRQAQRRDPVRLSAAIDGLLDAEGWGLAVSTGSVFGRWAEIVGPELAAHTTPESLTDGELTVAADSTAWATQVRLLAAQVILRLNRELGNGTVLRIKVRGPASGGRRPGQWRVRGGRGPRDTYG
ncbi:MAG: DUF721 domain-containing protein [Actinobacteria bacterium]|nr:DUF721 domain-containing protein [Actinomycetota bacterium]MBO0835802.1 DUF721 domain-containing protein [Actinomycetota bacterium]